MAMLSTTAGSVAFFLAHTIYSETGFFNVLGTNGEVWSLLSNLALLPHARRLARHLLARFEPPSEPQVRNLVRSLQHSGPCQGGLLVSSTNEPGFRQNGRNSTSSEPFSGLDLMGHPGASRNSPVMNGPNLATELARKRPLLVTWDVAHVVSRTPQPGSSRNSLVMLRWRSWGVARPMQQRTPTMVLSTRAHNQVSDLNWVQQSSSSSSDSHPVPIHEAASQPSPTGSSSVDRPPSGHTSSPNMMKRQLSGVPDEKVEDGRASSGGSASGEHVPSRWLSPIPFRTRVPPHQKWSSSPPGMPRPAPPPPSHGSQGFHG
ncbi:hypothetical protein DL96DRAFT_1711683 [Flagelloscypha sp. PMI_526]|nr:hypothetical protein DL96DRAFT_1711683 [Flagelloscypha sp. PMI_526]